MRQVLRHALGLAEAAQPVLPAGDDERGTGDALEVA
jgi:hypothetical protein